MTTTHTPTIIAACDGDDRGRQAIALGRVLADATGAHLLIAAVYPHPGLPFPPPIGHHVDARRTTDRAIRAVRDELAPGAHTVVVPGLSPAHALCKLAQDRQASMLVVGSRHAEEGRRMADADHALQVLHSAHTAVLVAPDDRPVAGTVRRIVVGFDDGAGSHDAVAWALELARATGAEVRLVSVVPQRGAGLVDHRRDARRARRPRRVGQDAPRSAGCRRRRGAGGRGRRGDLLRGGRRQRDR